MNFGQITIRPIDRWTGTKQCTGKLTSLEKIGLNKTLPEMIDNAFQALFFLHLNLNRAQIFLDYVFINLQLTPNIM